MEQNEAIEGIAEIMKWSHPDPLERPEKALVVMSGGQDSTTCLGVAKHLHDTVQAVTFNYGQKHAIEITVAKQICEKHNIPLQVVDVPMLKLMKSSALVNHGDTSHTHAYLDGVPASFVPARNALFLTMAWGLAMEMGAEYIYAGVCQTDYSGYPDCRDEFVQLLNETLICGYNTAISIRTPLMYLDKADTFQLAQKVGIFEDVMQMSHTCYNGDRTPNEWGAGCGECPACILRKKGFAEYMVRYVV